MHKVFLRSALYRPLQVTSKKVLFVGLSDLYVRVHLIVMDKLPCRSSSEHCLPTELSREFSLWNVASSLFGLVHLGLFQNTCHLQFCWLRYRPTRTLEKYRDSKDNKNRTSLFRVVKCVMIPRHTDASVSVTASSARLIYLGPHPDRIRNRLILPASRIVKALPHVSKSI